MNNDFSDDVCRCFRCDNLRAIEEARKTQVLNDVLIIASGFSLCIVIGIAIIYLLW